jgi:glycosyltransferase involved in cell wall biosynthesis
MRTLFLFHLGSNAGYAIRSLEQLFMETGLELSEGDPDAVHFAYRDLRNGRPEMLPPDFRNVIAHDFFDRTAANLRRLGAYVRARRIDLVVAFDLQPIDPLVSQLRRAGSSTFIAYWGAPVSSFQPRWKVFLKKAQFALTRSKVDGLIFESRAMVDSAARYRGVPASLIDLVPLGVRTDVFRPAVSSYAHDTFGFDRRRKVVVYTGHMEPRKGVHVIVDAAIELLARRHRDDVAFLLCGNRGTEGDSFAATVERAGLSAHVRLGGYRADLKQIFPSCFAGAIASTGWDSFTYSAIEMAACGLPVVASNLQGLAEAVADGETGLLFEPGNATALADSLERLLDEPQLARALGQRGRQRVEQSFSVEVQKRAFREALLRRARRISSPAAPGRGGLLRTRSSARS